MQTPAMFLMHVLEAFGVGYFCKTYHSETLCPSSYPPLLCGLGHCRFAMSRRGGGGVGERAGQWGRKGQQGRGLGQLPRGSSHSFPC